MAEGSGLMTELSRRQHEVMKLLCQGYSNKKLAETLDLTESTVKVHIRHILRVLGCNNRTEAALWYYKAYVSETGEPRLHPDQPTSQKPTGLDIAARKIVRTVPAPRDQRDLLDALELAGTNEPYEQVLMRLRRRITQERHDREWDAHVADLESRRCDG